MTQAANTTSFRTDTSRPGFGHGSSSPTVASDPMPQDIPVLGSGDGAAGRSGDAPEIPGMPTATAAGSEPGSSREQLIRDAAYRRYQARSEADGDSASDWLGAEAEIDAADARDR